MSVLVNVVLPRTGTTSFHCAAHVIGVASLHADHGVLSNGTLRVEHWMRVLASARSGRPLATWWERVLLNQSSVELARLLAYRVWSDAPFFHSFFADRQRPVRLRLRRALPHARFVCTTRSEASWVASMQRHGYAGAVFLGARYNMTPPWSAASRTTLLHVFREHHARECAGVPTMHVEDPPEFKWERLCSLLFGGQTAVDCARSAAHRPWPQATQALPRSRTVDRTHSCALGAEHG